jgi:hypothetical protein
MFQLIGRSRCGGYRRASSSSEVVRLYRPHMANHRTSRSSRSIRSQSSSRISADCRPVSGFSRSMTGVKIFHAYAAPNGYNNMDSNQRETSTVRACAGEYQKQRSHPPVSQGQGKGYAQRLLDGRGKESDIRFEDIIAWAELPRPFFRFGQ